MPSTKKSPAKKTVRPRPTQAARARFEKNDRAIGRVTKSLEAAQKDLAAIGGTVGTGAGDLRKDVAKLLRDANRHVTKMSKTVRRDLERLQKDVTAASKAKPRRARTGTSRAKPRTRTAPRTRRKSA
jgi:hypothetical protein